MKILLGGLLHSRGKITDCHIYHLNALDLSGLEVSKFFVIDGQREARELPKDANYLNVYDAGPYWTREPRGNEDNRPEFRRLAFLRNLLRERALMEEVDALISIDSDICVPPDLVQRMVRAEASWVAALVDNAAKRDGKHEQELIRMAGGERNYDRPCFNVMNFDDKMLTERFVPDLVQGGEADITGAVCYYSKELLRLVSWQWHSCGEDVGFAQQVKARGLSRARYLPVLCDHLMSEDRLKLHQERCPLCQG